MLKYLLFWVVFDVWLALAAYSGYSLWASFTSGERVSLLGVLALMLALNVWLRGIYKSILRDRLLARERGPTRL